VAIICSDYERSKCFYTEVLGFAIIREVYRTERQSFRLELRSGDCQLELFSFPNPPPRPSTPEAQGLRHLAFEVEDLEDTVCALVAHGVVVEPIRVDKETSKRFTFFPNPDGLPIELYER
jgi:glyoxylase I family protein